MLRQVFAVALACGLAGQAHAEQITFAFHTDGGIGVAYGQFLAQLGLSPGMPMRGTVSYDPATRGTTAPDGTVNFSSPGGMTVQVGGLTFASGPSDQLLAVWHPQRPPGVTGLPFPEFLTLTARPKDPGLFGGPAGDSYLRLDIYPRLPGTWSGSLPTSLTDFGGGAGVVSIRFAGPHPDFFFPALYMDGVVTGMSPLPPEAPEPGTLALAAFGAGLLLYRFRNSRANRTPDYDPDRAREVGWQQAFKEKRARQNGEALAALDRQAREKAQAGRLALTIAPAADTVAPSGSVVGHQGAQQEG